MKNIYQIVGMLLLSSILLQAQSKKEGWKPLFNGKNLNGWYVHVSGLDKNADPTKIVSVTDGMIHMFASHEQGTKQPIAVVVTEQEYADYDLRFQYKWGEKKFAPRVDKIRDAGLLYHCWEERVWPSSVECQIQEGDTGDIFVVRSRIETSIDPKQKPKRIFLAEKDGGVMETFAATNGVIGIRKTHIAEKDGWNTVEVKIRGDSAVHIINGQTNAMVFAMKKPVDGNWEPLTKGRIALQAEFAEVFYRNIEVRPAKTKSVKK